MDEPTIQGRPYVNPPLQAVLDLHGELLAEHGGGPGIRDLGALEASLARPFQIIAYGDERLTIFDLAAAEREAADTILALAARTLTEEKFRDWVADHAYDVGEQEA